MLTVNLDHDDDIKMWLEKLGHMTRQDLRELLVAEGCAGRRGHINACPIAVFLFKKTFYCPKVTGLATVGRYGVYLNPLVIRHFVEDFDEGKYPELTL